MPDKSLIVEPHSIDLNNVVADIEAIRRHNPQRFEMEQLSAIVRDDDAAGIVIGYKDTTEEDFWVQGHMPGMPLMPGVLMCEAAAQVCSYQSMTQNLMGGMLGFGGLDQVRFRGPVKPGDRLVVAAERIKHRQGAMVVYRFQCFVGENLVCEGLIRGVPLPKM